MYPPELVRRHWEGRGEGVPVRTLSGVETGLDIKPAQLVSGLARYSSARYGSTRYSSLYKQARKLVRLGSLVARASSFDSRARV